MKYELEVSEAIASITKAADRIVAQAESEDDLAAFSLRDDLMRALLVIDEIQEQATLLLKLLRDAHSAWIDFVDLERYIRVMAPSADPSYLEAKDRLNDLFDSKTIDALDAILNN